MSEERVREHIRKALAEVEEQRDDAVVYLSTIKVLLDVLAHGQAMSECGREIAQGIVRQLALESCAIVLAEERQGELALAGVAGEGPGEDGWLALAQLLRPGDSAACFRRTRTGFEAIPPGGLTGEGYLVLPLAVGGEAAGALVLHSLVAPAAVFARQRALALVADIVGQVLTIARVRASMQRLCTDLENELGMTRRALSDQQQSLRAHEENIEALTQALVRSNRVKREFLSAVSHELRTPLNAILGYTSIVREGMAGTVTDEQSSLLDRALSNTRNLNWLIDDVLFCVEIEAGRVQVHRERVVVGELIAAVVSELPEVPDQVRVPLRVEVAPEAAVLHVDGSLVRRLLFHLLGNAFKFTTKGEVTVRVRPGDVRGAVELSVRDTGIGIPADRREEIFRLFGPADEARGRQARGLGIGLTLVQRCVRLLGGDVAVESPPGGGSEFRVRIPDALVRAHETRFPAHRTVH